MGLFDKLESKLEQGVNGAFARAFKSEVQPVEIASGMRRAMDDRAASVKKGKRPIVPNLFTIELSPTDYERLSSWGRDLDDELIAAAQEHADEQRYLPGGPFTIVLDENAELETGVFHLRTATARAAEAAAHANAHPRPRAGAAGRADASHGGHGGHDQADAPYDHSYGSAAPAPTPAAPRGTSGSASEPTPAAASAAPKPARPAGNSERGLGSRIKDYLRGGGYVDPSTTGTGTNDAVAPAPSRQQAQAAADDAWHDEAFEPDNDYTDERDHGYLNSEYTPGQNHEHGRETARSAEPVGHEAPHAPRPHGAAAPLPGSLGRQFDRQAAQPTPAAGGSSALPGANARPDAAANQEEPPMPTYSNGFTPSKRHAWDDDDDLDDATSYEPAADSTSRFESPAPAPAAPRKMSPRERPWLKIDGQRYPLMGAITVLGRDDDADIIIDDPGVSRRHSEIRITHDGPHLVMSIRDLGSTNGTFVNSDPVESQHIFDGDSITLGRTSMTIHLGDRA